MFNQVRPNSSIPVYVDGSFWEEGYGIPSDLQCGCSIRAGYGVYFPISNRSFYGRAPDYVQTNNDAEIYAIIQAMRHFGNDYTRLLVFTDSQNAIRICGQYDNWLSCTYGYNRLEQELFQEINNLNQLPHFHYVRAHSNDQGNNMAHSLARQGMRSSCRGYCA